jgi:hypothetical protein
MEIIKQILKKILVFIHILVSLFLAFGFIMPEPFLFYFLFTWPAIYLHWQINDNRCILTDLEYYLDGKEQAPKNNYEFPFVKKQLAKINIKPTNDMQIYYFFIYGMTTFWIIGLIRYMYSRKEQKKADNI